MGDAEGGGNETVRRGDDLVARPDVKRPQSQFEGGCSGIHTDGVMRAAESGELFLEEAHLAAQDEV